MEAPKNEVVWVQIILQIKLRQVAIWIYFPEYFCVLLLKHPICELEMIHSLFIINHSGWVSIFMLNSSWLLIFRYFFIMSYRCEPLEIDFHHVCFLPILVKRSAIGFYREIFLEKHWRSVLGRSVCDHFFEAQGKVSKSWSQSHFHVMLLKFAYITDHLSRYFANVENQQNMIIGKSVLKLTCSAKLETNEEIWGNVLLLKLAMFIRTSEDLCARRQRKHLGMWKG